MIQCRWVLGLVAMVLVVVLFTMPTSAQSQTQMTCEQQAVILDQLVGDISSSRRSAEIDAATLRVRVRVLESDLKAAQKPVLAPAPPATPASTPSEH